MTSKKQIAANRRNASKSTGPKTGDGKNVVRYNALRHGLTAEHLVLPGESEEEFRDLRAQFHDEFAPQGTFETFLVDQMVTYAWRMMRLSKVETGVYAHIQKEIDREIRSWGNIREVVQRNRSDKRTNKKDNYEYQISLGDAFLIATQKADAFSKISRYESSIRAGFYSAYQELARVQSGRREREETTG